MVTRPLPRVLLLHTGGTLGMDPMARIVGMRAFHLLLLTPCLAASMTNDCAPPLMPPPSHAPPTLARRPSRPTTRAST